jgi:natural product precursor
VVSIIVEDIIVSIKRRTKMQKKPGLKKLSLSKLTIAVLNDSEKESLVGGQAPTTCGTCPPYRLISVNYKCEGSVGTCSTL